MRQKVFRKFSVLCFSYRSWRWKRESSRGVCRFLLTFYRFFVEMEKAFRRFCRFFFLTGFISEVKNFATGFPTHFLFAGFYRETKNFARIFIISSLLTSLYRVFIKKQITSATIFLLIFFFRFLFALFFPCVFSPPPACKKRPSFLRGFWLRRYLFWI